MNSRTILCGLLTVALVSGVARAEDDDARKARINAAVDKGVEYLLREQAKNQLGKHSLGQLALETYALVVAGVSVDHPQVRSNYAYLKRSMRKSLLTYANACYVMALDAAIAQIEYDYVLLDPKRAREGRITATRPYEAELATFVQAFLKTQNSHGAWRYGMSSDVDNSATQFAVLALGVGAMRGVPIPESAWQRIADYFIKYQQASGPRSNDRITLLPEEQRAERRALAAAARKLTKSPVVRRKRERARDDDDGRKRGRGAEEGGDERRGTTVSGKTTLSEPENLDPVVGKEFEPGNNRGWDYDNKGGATWNMSCAGLSSMLLVRENLRFSVGPERLDAINKAIRDGYGKVMELWNPLESFYGMYSLEKVADIGGVKLFKGIDWYEQITNHLLSKQEPTGRWVSGKGHGENADPRIPTAFALLILRRATSIVFEDPASRLLKPGKDERTVAQSNREWIYLDELDQRVHAPAFFEVLQKRPNAKLLKSLRTLVDAYPLVWKGDLVPHLLDTRKALKQKSAQKIIDGYLEDVAGVEFDDPDQYRVWHNTWSRVEQLAEERSADRIPELMRYYEDSLGSYPLKEMVATALVRVNARQAAPAFLADLEHRDRETRELAYRSFKSLFIDIAPEFDATGSSKTRREQIEALRAWYEERKGK